MSLMSHFSTSTLIHAVLAYVSPEAATFNHIIYLHSAGALTLSSSSSSRTTILSLPPEILFRIRSALQHALTASLLTSSYAALSAYEQTATAGLCTDCKFYNAEVYGSDVWDWPDFGSACGCWDIGLGPSARVRARTTTWTCPPSLAGVAVYGPMDESIIRTRHSTGTHIVPFQFLTSHISLALTQTASTMPSSPYASSCAQGIENLFSTVLTGFGCTFKGPGPADMRLWAALASAFHWEGNPDSYHGGIVTLRPTEGQEMPSVYDQTIIIHRLTRELGLSHEYPVLRKPRVTRLARPLGRVTATRRRWFSLTPSTNSSLALIVLPSYILQTLVIITFMGTRYSLLLGHRVLRQFLAF